MKGNVITVVVLRCNDYLLQVWRHLVEGCPLPRSHVLVGLEENLEYSLRAVAGVCHHILPYTQPLQDGIIQLPCIHGYRVLLLILLLLVIVGVGEGYHDSEVVGQCRLYPKVLGTLCYLNQRYVHSYLLLSNT